MNVVSGTRRTMKPQSAAAIRAKRKYFEAHREEFAERAKIWVQENRDRSNAYKRAYKAKNKERINARRRELYAENPQPHRARSLEFYKNNPEYKRAFDEQRRLDGYFSRWKRDNKEKVNAATRNRRAKLRASEGRHSEEDVMRLLRASNGRCYWCKGDLDDGFEIDHVWPVALGGANHVGNLCISCPTCNKKKGAKPPTIFAGVLL